MADRRSCRWLRCEARSARLCFSIWYLAKSTVRHPRYLRSAAHSHLPRHKFGFSKTFFPTRVCFRQITRCNDQTIRFNVVFCLCTKILSDFRPTKQIFQQKHVQCQTIFKQSNFFIDFEVHYSFHFWFEQQRCHYRNCVRMTDKTPKIWVELYLQEQLRFSVPHTKVKPPRLCLTKTNYFELVPIEYLFEKIKREVTKPEESKLQMIFNVS